MSGSEAPGVSDGANGADGAVSSGTAGYSRTAVLANAVVSVVLTVLTIWWVSGFNLFYERLFRVSPTVSGGGVGTDFVAGNTIGWLNWLVAAIHLVDVLMGLFILLMVFVHWGAFRRLATRMQGPETVTDGGTDGGADSPGGERE